MQISRLWRLPQIVLTSRVNGKANERMRTYEGYEGLALGCSIARKQQPRQSEEPLNSPRSINVLKHTVALDSHLVPISHRPMSLYNPPSPPSKSSILITNKHLYTLAFRSQSTNQSIKTAGIGFEYNVPRGVTKPFDQDIAFQHGCVAM